MYQGHCSDGSSIQKHSAGPLYPFVVYETHDGRTHVMHPCGTSVLVAGRSDAADFVQGVRYYANAEGVSLTHAMGQFAMEDGRYFDPL